MRKNQIVHWTVGLAFWSVIALLAVGCGGSFKGKDLSAWAPVSFQVVNGGQDNWVTAHRTSGLSNDNNYFVVEGIGSYKETDTQWVLCELYLYLPKGTYTVGQKLDITQAKQSQDAEKKFLPFVRYNEYTLDGKAGEQLFSLKVTTGTPQTTPKIEYGQVSGTVEILEAKGNAFAGEFNLFLTSPKGSIKRTLKNGEFVYEPYVEKD